MEIAALILNFAAALLTFAYLGALFLSDRLNARLTGSHFSEYGFTKRSLLNQNVNYSLKRRA